VDKSTRDQANQGTNLDEEESSGPSGFDEGVCWCWNQREALEAAVVDVRAGADSGCAGVFVVVVVVAM